MPKPILITEECSNSFRKLVSANPELLELLTPKLSKYIPHKPTPKQEAFLLLDDRDVFYGGAAGGGKSDALLMSALQYVEVPEYTALIVRATYKDLSLPDAIMDRAKSWLAPHKDVNWSEQDKAFTFPSGARIVFGYLDGPNDHFQYQSARFHCILVDEASQLRWTQVMYLFSRLRKSSGCRVPLRFRCASNPGGKSHLEIKQRYIDEVTRGNRIYIPASLSDNPYLDQASYMENLNELDPITRAQLRDGNWDVLPQGGLFKSEWFEVVKQAPMEAKRCRWWDLAGTPKRNDNDPDWTAGAKLAMHKGICYIEDIKRTRSSPKEVEMLVRITAEADGREVRQCMEQEPGSAGQAVIDHYRRNILLGFDFHGYRSTGDKVSYARPLSSSAEAGNVKLVAGPWIRDFLDEAVIFPLGNHDDQVDSASKAFAQMARKASVGTW